MPATTTPTANVAPNRARPAVMTLSEAAAERVNQIVEGSNGGILGIRLSVKKGGCAGMEYDISAVTGEANARDEVITHHGATVYIDPMAVLFLLGTRMDYEETKFRSGFTFVNPNQVSACGCGESVELRAAE
ncbi:MAG: iron-sulfur cluster assembly accessory protein [Pseudomonadota bacterium]